MSMMAYFVGENIGKRDDIYQIAVLVDHKSNLGMTSLTGTIIDGD